MNTCVTHPEKIAKRPDFGPLRASSGPTHLADTAITILLPWPPRALSPNARGHWAVLHKARSRYRRAAASAAMLHGARAWGRLADGPVQVCISFTPPDRRRRDWDNLLASMKPALDGIADATGIDDSRFRLAMQVTGETVKGGAVEVTLCHA